MPDLLNGISVLARLEHVHVKRFFVSESIIADGASESGIGGRGWIRTSIRSVMSTQLYH